MNLYSILGLSREPSPTPADVKRAYRKAAGKAHPDKGGTSEKFAAIVLARDVLLDPRRRSKYDDTGAIDEKAIDQTETDALQKVRTALDFVFGRIGARRVEEFDVVADAGAHLEGEIRQVEMQIAQAKREAAKWHKLATRFHRTGDGPNKIAPMIESKAIEIERGIEAQQPALASHRRAIEILKEHSFEVDRSGEWAV